MTVAVCLLGSAPGVAHAYRPFDSTDAAVAPQGEAEVELGPVGLLRDADGQFLVVPALILNLGVARDTELVVEAKQLLPATREARAPRWRVTDTAFSLKRVLRPGSLQGASGPSVAAELGVLVPAIHDEPGVGALCTAIVSQRFPWVTAHLNGALAWTRDSQLGLVGGLILEGPPSWVVRPVAEALGEWDSRARLASGLIGAIWQVADSVSFDAAVRAGQAGAANLYEVRAGLTFSFAVWRPE